MRKQSLTGEPLPRLLTTMDAAKFLGLSRWGVLRLAREGDLAFEPTRSGQLIFHFIDVQRCGLQRANAKTCSRGATLAAIHLKMVKAGIEPRQLSFFHGVGLRIVARGERAVHDRGVKAARSFDKTHGSESQRYVDRKAAGSRR